MMKSFTVSINIYPFVQLYYKKVMSISKSKKLQ